MKTNLLKLKRKHPFWFELFYQDEINRRTIKRISKKKRLFYLNKKQMNVGGWDIDRDAYDACIIALHTIEQLKN